MTLFNSKAVTAFNGDDLIASNNAVADRFEAEHGTRNTRRGFLKAGAAVTAALGFWLPSLSQAAIPPQGGIDSGRSIKLVNAHTNETFKGEYWYNGRYIPNAFGEIKHVMKDWRNGETFPIDPRLMDILYVLQNRIGNPNSFEIFSGYRSPKTNAMLRRETEGVAKGSLHMTGQAIDLKLPGTNLNNVRAQAIGLKSGGVGYYPSSGFVHIDTGRVRTW